MRVLLFFVLFFLLFLPVAFAACPPACPPDYQCGGYVDPGTYYGCFEGSGKNQSWYSDFSSYTRVNFTVSLSMSSDDDLDLFLYDPDGFLIDKSSSKIPGAPEQISICGKNGTWTSDVYSYSVQGGYASYSITISAINQECCDDSDCETGEICKNGQCVFHCYPEGAECSDDSECCSGICDERCCKATCPQDDFTCSGSSITYREYYCDVNGDCKYNEYLRDWNKPDSNGYIRDWLILGPFKDIDCGCEPCFSSSMERRGCDNWFDFSSISPIGGMKTAGQTWFIHHNSDELIDFENDVFGSGVLKDYVTAFAFAYIYSPEERDAKLAVGYNNGITVWLNGNKILDKSSECRYGYGETEDVVNTHLNKGMNKLLIRVGEKTGVWVFKARFKFLDGRPMTDVNISIPSYSYNCEDFNGWVTYTFSSSSCCSLYNYTYYASYYCSGKSCKQTASSATSEKISDLNTGLACGNNYCSGAYGYNKTCANGYCTSFLILNCSDNYACTYDRCSGLASSCYHCVNEGYSTSSPGCNYVCCSGLTLKSCSFGSVCCPRDYCYYSSYYYPTPCKRCRTKTCYVYSCPSVEGERCPYTVTQTEECENVNEGKICDVGSSQCIDECNKGRNVYKCTSGECLPTNEFASLVAYWKFDENSGDKAYDSSGYGNNGTLYGGLDTTGWTNGKFNFALNFDGIDDYVSIPNSPSLQTIAQLTIEAWININKIQSRMTIVSKHYNEYELMIDNSGSQLRFYKFDRNSNYWECAYISFSFETQKWYHLGVTMNGTKITFYINGVKYSPSGYFYSPMAYGTIPGTHPLYIGRRVWSTNYFNGIIDEVKIYNYALTDEEILKEYLNGPYSNPNSCSPFSCSQGICTDICKSNCGADLSCDEKAIGSSCEINKICNESCNCVLDCSIFDENSCPAPDCEWCSGDNQCKPASQVECQPGQCNGNALYCNAHCTWSLCPGTNAECSCKNGICEPCIGGTCNNFICQLPCSPGECSIPTPPFCISNGQCWGDYICRNGNLEEHKGDGICNCGETSLDTPEDCKRYHITLYRGWNLISIPFKKISTIESDTCNSENLPFYHWDNQNKKWEIVYGITNLKFGEAYWVNPQWHLGKEYMPLYEGCDINISASDAGSLSELPDLTAGYNQVGSVWNRISPFPTGNCQISIGPLYWDPHKKRWSEASDMIRGQGYWIYTTNDCRLG